MVQARWWCYRWFEAMNGFGGEGERRKMEKGGGSSATTTEENPANISPPPPLGITTDTVPPEPMDIEKDVPRENSVDFFTQACKALTLRSPFDSDELTQPSTSGASGSNVGGVASALLPGAWMLYMAKNSDSRKHKKSHSGSEFKKRVEKPRGSAFWDKLEEYFRELAVDDINKLQLLSSGLNASDKCLLIPSRSINHHAGDLDTVGKGCYMCRMSRLLKMDSVDAVQGGSLRDSVDAVQGVSLRDTAVKEEELTEENEQEHMDVDIVGGVNEESKQQNHVSWRDPPREEDPPISCLEWLLGSRNKVYLTTERPSKKRKLVGGDAGLQKILVPRPVEGSASLCHYCSNSVFSGESNRLITCTLCGMSVHRICYGVQCDIDDNWVCSWCKHKSNHRNVEMPCLLCPKQGGALKPALITENAGRLVNYVHLFCCQWTPEVYVENTRIMGPIRNIDRINDTRRKLICYLCKVKHGACVRCSNGSCRTSFHPICAREAGHRMEIWGRLGCDEVELRAFCSKHSDMHNNVSNKSAGETLMPQPMMDYASDKGAVAGVNGSCGQDCFDMLKQLIDQGKIDVKDVAVDFGESAEVLTQNKLMVPNLRFKLVEWLKNHGYIDDLLETKYKSSAAEECVAFKGDTVTKSVLAAESGIGCLVPVKSLPSQRPKKDMKVLKSEEGVGGTNEGMSETNEVCKDEPSDEVQQHLTSEESYSSKESADGILKNSGKAADGNSFEAEGEQITDYKVCITNNGHLNEATKPEDIVRTNICVPNSTSANPPSNQMPDNFKLETCDSFIHPLIRHKLIGMDDGQDYDGDRKISQFGASSSSGYCCSQHNQQCSNDFISKIYGSNLEQLVNARNMGLLAFSPTCEVEGELIYYQHRLLSNTVTRKRLIDGLTSKVSENLQQEIVDARRSQWDAVLLSQYLNDLREAKKQGRKERRQKEAQAILAAATAAVASSTRNSSLRKDSLNESAHVEDTSSIRTSNGRGVIQSHQNLLAKDTLSRSAATGLLPDKQSGPFNLSPDSSFEHSRICDICQRGDTNLNPILVCSSCKVSVHLDCYRKVQKSPGPWYCELCEELMRSSATNMSNSWEKPYIVAECGFCGGTAGAFRKSIDGQWIHAFCAEWVLETKVTRGQVQYIEGMETLSKGGDVCAICGRRQGVCIKCNYGNCQSSFHPSCARSTGFYMNVRSIGGKLQHKAYCEKHSLDQRTKVEKHGVEEFTRLRKVRVELERLRLLCERIVKREKLKREFVLCSHDILTSKRDAAVFLALSHHVCHNDASSESATTSTRGYTEGNNCSDTFQRSDDLTVDSRVAGKRRVKILTAIDSDQKTDDSSVSQHVTPIPADRGSSLAGKHILSRPSVDTHSTLDDADVRSGSKKHAETFEKEIVMTSDQASMKNQRLPKGFVYVPVGRLAKGKESVPDAFCEER